MGWVIIVLLLIYLLINYWPLFLVALIIIAAISVYFHFHKMTEIKIEEQPENDRYTICAAVSKYFYDEVKQYCKKHRMTVSDLIRDSVKAYMDDHR